MDENEPIIDTSNMTTEEQEQVNDATEIIDKLDLVIDQLNDDLCDDKCKIEEQIKECRENQQKTSEEYIKCENLIRNYKSEYSINIREENEELFKQEIAELLYNFKYNHELSNDNINQLISDYETLIIYYNKLLVLYNKIKNEKYEYDEKIDDYNKIVNTSDRKTFYEDENINKMDNRKYILLIIYWLLFSYLSYKLLYLNKQYKDIKIWIELILLFILPLYGLYYIKLVFIYVYEKIKLFYYKYISLK
jgi:hypothetical protein